MLKQEINQIESKLFKLLNMFKSDTKLQELWFELIKISNLQIESNFLGIMIVIKKNVRFSLNTKMVFNLSSNNFVKDNLILMMAKGQYIVK